MPGVIGADRGLQHPEIEGEQADQAAGAAGAAGASFTGAKGKDQYQNGVFDFSQGSLPSGNQAIIGAVTSVQGHFELDPAKVKYAQEVAARNAVLAENEEIRTHNAPIQSEIDELEAQERSLDALLNHIDARGDGVLTWKEVNDLTNSTIPEVAEAAKWLVHHRDIYFKVKAEGGSRGTLTGGENEAGDGPQLVGGTGIGRTESGKYRSELHASIEAKKKKLKKEKPVPSEPVPPGAAPAQPNSSSSPSTGASASTGSSASNAGSSSTVSGSGALAGASPGLVGLGEGIDGIQARINKLVENTKEHPENANKNQAEISQLSNQMTVLSSLMNQLFTMQSNLSKMMSEMAMTAIRNMR